MENKKLTAVQELISIYEEHKKNKGSLYGFTLTKKLQKKLLELEKEQMIDFYYGCWDCGSPFKTKRDNLPNQYYNQVCGNKESN